MGLGPLPRRGRALGPGPTRQRAYAMELIHPPGWPRGSGYAHGVAASGRIVSVAGQIGWDPSTRILVAPDLAAQAGRALANIATVLRAANAAPTDVVRMTWYLTDRAAYLAAQKSIGAAYRETFGQHYPAMTVVFVAALVEEGALIEIDATAVVA